MFILIIKYAKMYKSKSDDTINHKKNTLKYATVEVYNLL